VTFTRVDAGGVSALKCVPQGLINPERWIVYLHGGGFVTGSAEDSRDILARLSFSANAAVMGIDYRLAPEAAFPSAHEDCLAATRYVTTLAGGTSRVALAGDSAGGNLCLATLVALRNGGWDLPGACVLMSPWIDPSADGGSMTDRLETDIINPRLLDCWREAYLQGNDSGLSELNLLQARLDGLPPMLIQFGEGEIFYDQIQAFSTRLKAAKVDVSLAGYAGHFHTFQTFAALLPRGRDALHEAGVFISRHLAEKRAV